MAKSNQAIDLTLIVTCHSEGIILHHTLKSIQRALAAAKDVSCELIIHLDNPTPAMKEYEQRIKHVFPSASIYKNSFGDPGSSRNFCLTKASGRYTGFIDGDDLMSKNWIKDALAKLDELPYGKAVAHSAMTVEFGGMNAIVQKHSAINYATDALLNVWSGRWNAILIGPTNIFKEIGYPSNKPGYGFEDWLFSCELIDKKLDNILIPQTVMFVRRKLKNSVWDNARNSRALLPASHLLSFATVRQLEANDDFSSTQELAQNGSKKHKLKVKATEYLSKNSLVDQVARKLYGSYKNRTAKGLANTETASSTTVPSWLLKEWQAIHAVDRRIFPTADILNSTPTYQTITPVHYAVGGAYKKAVDRTRSSKYDYILFVPWLTTGGADKFAIDYANTIALADTSKRVMVIATNYGAMSPRAGELDDSIDFIPLGEIISEHKLEPEHQQRLLEQLIENSGAQYLHILNSALAYEFTYLHESYLKDTGKKVIITSFSQSKDATGRVFGFSHTHVPDAYEVASAITTDNAAVKDMWVNEYGFDEGKILIHRPKIDPKSYSPKSSHKQPDNNQPLKVLWAARLAPEKLPHIVGKIAEHTKQPVEIDMYGTPDAGYPTNFLASLPANVRYRGSFSSFFALPLQDYDTYLYTSLFDGLPNALVEASVAKLPIVASAVGGVPEFIGNSNGVLIQNPNDTAEYAKALDLLAVDSSLRTSLTNAAYEELNNGYTPASHRERILKMLKLVGYLQ